MRAHDSAKRAQVIELRRSGMSNRRIAERLQVPYGTVGYWLHRERLRQGVITPHPGRDGRRRACPRCEGRSFDKQAYAYLLGLYLGDGHIIRYSAHRVPSLMVACGDAWPGLMAECEKAMRQVFPHNSVCRVRRTGCHNVKVYSQHLWCLFPQHGSGRKHERPILLARWQQEIVDAHPWELLRGLVHSDGCRITNWTTRMVAGQRKRYEYPRYFFTNVSEDIRALYCRTLDQVGVEWKVTRRGTVPYNISVARRASVALMDARIGPKY
ncbi:helix-turn-helix domain-containing protein [Streptomyces reniochalinae]|uniref:Helix-turn-helix domain-containing protein n=1 Tax=Streptomyces reniochalinae TaxID=2250578 RepID=A0A367EEI0_9ACTN|nr:helix-turn-helix domain-containing protein [Streptomyces reniochalinae]RCG16486.1 helix-turn-helix domain-containing protein [Streptomyces reniochalinae]